MSVLLMLNVFPWLHFISVDLVLFAWIFGNLISIGVSLPSPSPSHFHLVIKFSIVSNFVFHVLLLLRISTDCGIGGGSSVAMAFFASSPEPLKPKTLYVKVIRSL